jgi:ribosomal protein S18 acetylase RimI-like enzyme
MSDDFLNGLSVDRRAEYWLKIIAENPADVAVSEAAAGVVGFVAIASARDNDAERGTGELTAIYLDPPSWRQGFGRDLMNWSMESARSRHWRKMTLWVLKENIQARSFY